MKIFAQRHPLLWAYLFFAYFSVLVQGLIYFSGMSGFVGFRQAIIVSLLWLIPLLLWPKRSKQISALLAIPIWAAAISALGYWLIYSQDFSQSVIFIIFESNWAEGSEFIQSYFRWWYAPVFIIFSIIPFLIWRVMPRNILLSTRSRYIYLALFISILSWPFFKTLLINHEGFEEAKNEFLERLEPASPWNIVVAYTKYRQQLSVMNKMLAKNKQLPKLAGFKTVDTLPNTVVLVIGESTNRQRMSLYGYQRETTPNLDAMKNDLLVFNDVVTPRPYTIEALQQVLSFADSKEPDRFFSQPTLLNIMKDAGYSITWITNQQTQTKRNTLLTMLSQLADKQIYLNNNRAQNADQYDGNVLKPFFASLKQSSSKQFIIVHLLGTHRKYHFRYPPEFNHFTNHDLVPAWVGDENIDEYNAYDNAVLYNDSVVSSLIKQLAKKNDSSVLFYFSDHGEEVFDYPNKLFAGRNENAPTPAMYTIPFIIWSSDKFKSHAPFTLWQSFENRPFSNADFIYTFSDIVGIDYNMLDPTRSLISDSFTVHPRWIGDPLEPKSLQDFGDIKTPRR